MKNKALADRDLHVLWHPCTQMKDHETYPIIPIQRAQGLTLEDYNGKKYIDAIGSWWVSLLGHQHPRITAALQAQLEQLSHVMFAGFTHEPAIALAERLVKLSSLTHVFYGDNGSSAIEIALKMSCHAWGHQGKPNKKKFMTLMNSYHGETIGALSVTDMGNFKKHYEDLLFEPIVLPCAYAAQDDESVLAQIKQILSQHAHETCALIVEPLVQCAAGMRMHTPHFLKQLFLLMREHDIHFIADEIAVGFGRTGTMFACEQAGITPDFMCVSKGLTGGYLPLSAVLTNDFIYQLFYDDYHTGKAFLHSHSYTGNALACAAAVATIDTLIDENILEKNNALISHFDQALKPFREHPHVGDVRQKGMIIAIEMRRDRQHDYPSQERRGMTVYSHALEKGVFLRPLGNVVYFMPAYCITPDEIDRLCDVTLSAINAATEEH